MLTFRRGSILLLLTVMITTMIFGCQVREKTFNGDIDFNKELNLVVWNTQGTDYVDVVNNSKNIVEDWLAKKTKVRVETIYGNDGGQWDPKLTKLIAGNNMPHIVVCQANQGPAHFAKLDQLKQVWELTPEILKKYAPNIWARTPEKYWDKISVGGKILGFPANLFQIDEITNPKMTEEEIKFANDNFLSYETTDVTVFTTTMYIRDDILKTIFPKTRTFGELFKLVQQRKEPIGDELLDIPIFTTDEYIDFMYKIKDLNLKEEGKSVYAFGYNGSDNWTALSHLGAEMMGYKGHYYVSSWNDKEKSIQIPLVSDIVRSAGRIQNRMINDKVIEPESLAHTNALYNEKVLKGLYAIIPTLPTTLRDVNDSLKESGKDFAYRPFITQVPASEGYEPYITDRAWSTAVSFTKTLTENEFYQALTYFDLQFTDEFEEIYYWGTEENGLYTMNEDGTRMYVDENLTQKILYRNSNIDDSLCYGLAGTGRFFPAMFFRASIWDPIMMNKIVDYEIGNIRGFMFSTDSEHVTNVKIKAPPCKCYQPEFAEIPEVILYWSNREQWESAFKIALAARNEDEFEQKWDAAIKTLNEIVSMDDLANAMTEVARPLYEAMQ